MAETSQNGGDSSSKTGIPTGLNRIKTRPVLKDPLSSKLTGFKGLYMCSSVYVCLCVCLFVCSLFHIDDSPDCVYVSQGCICKSVYELLVVVCCTVIVQFFCLRIHSLRCLCILIWLAVLTRYKIVSIAKNVLICFPIFALTIIVFEKSEFIS